MAANKEPARTARRMEPTEGVTVQRFDEAYFDRYYERLESRVHGPTEVGNLVRGIAGLAAYWGIPIQTVLDVGAGPGFYREAIQREIPGAVYSSIDISPVACARYGHVEASVVDYAPGTTFDLVICQGVLQYLPSALCHKALKNLDVLCRGLLYLEALTVHDVEEVADLSKTDDDVFLRTGEWYRRRLAPHFQTVGAGLHCSRRASSVFFELERADGLAPGACLPWRRPPAWWLRPAWRPPPCHPSRPSGTPLPSQFPPRAERSGGCWRGGNDLGSAVVRG